MRSGNYVILDATFRYVSGHGLEAFSFHHISEMKLWSFGDK